MTNRKIAIFTDVHSLVEPLKAILNDIKEKNITEIYSLGDNIDKGPNPREVMNLLKENNVFSIAGNAEEYIRLGIEPFTYFYEGKKKSISWTRSELTDEQLKEIENYPVWKELRLGKKRIALCHFANDIRFDYQEDSSWNYVKNINMGLKAYEQFFVTNSKEQKEYINSILLEKDITNPKLKGIEAAKKTPLFDGETVDKFDIVIQGHCHWKIIESSPKTKFYSIRAAGMAYETDKNLASYVILSENNNDITVEQVLVPYNREEMVESVINSPSPDQVIYKYIAYDGQPSNG